MGLPVNNPEWKLDQLLSSLPPDTAENARVRENMLVGARRLLLALERPDNVVGRVCFGIWDTISIKIAMDLGIFELLEAKSPRSAEDIASSTKGSPDLVYRILRCLGAHGSLNEETDGGYGATSVSSTFADPRHQAAMNALYGYMLPGWITTPAFLEEIGYQNPKSSTKTAFSKAYNKPQGATIWELLSASPYMDEFNRFMGSYNDGHQSWMDIYPVQERLATGASTNPDSVIMVDAGGGHGQQAINLKREFPDLPGRFIIEDLAHGLPSQPVDGVEYLVHDLMTEQPVKGARFYYLRWVIHDWPQEVCIQMLRHIQEAMKPGYSKVIINEWIIPERGATTFLATQDLNMMSFGGGMERTKKQHQDYIEKAGLQITGIWMPDDNTCLLPDLVSNLQKYIGNTGKL